MPPPVYDIAEPERPGSPPEFHAPTVPMWIFDQKTLAILEVNKAAIRYYGYSRAEFLKMTILDIRPLADIPKLRRVFFALLSAS